MTIQICAPVWAQIEWHRIIQLCDVIVLEIKCLKNPIRLKSMYQEGRIPLETWIEVFLTFSSF